MKGKTTYGDKRQFNFKNPSSDRLIQHIIKDPCSLRMALIANHNFKTPNEDYNSAQASDSIEEPQDNRFKRELLFKQ